MVTLHKFIHEEPVKASCCNNRTSTTYWLAESREQAEQEIREKADDRKPHGLCARDMAELLSTEDYKIEKGEAQ